MCMANPNPLHGVRVGVPQEYFVEGMERRRINHPRRHAHLQSLGAEIREVSLPHTEFALPTYYILAPAEASANLARYDGVKYGPRADVPGDVWDVMRATRGRGFGSEVKRRIMLGTYALSHGLLRRLLCQGAKGADADQARFRPRV